MKSLTKRCWCCNREKPRTAFATYHKRACVDCEAGISLRKCIDCGEERPLSQFPKRDKRCTRYRHRCYVCRTKNGRMRERRPRDTKSGPYIEKHGFKEWRKIYSLLCRYDITYDQYMDLLARQDGRCAICRTDVCPARGRLSVDHCHETNAIRGILCAICNAGLGSFQDSQQLLQRAIDYLEQAKHSTLVVGAYGYANGSQKPRARVPKGTHTQRFLT